MPVGSRSSPSEEDIMEIKTKILEEKRDYLCKFLNPETHFPYLRSVCILTKEDQEQIQSHVTSKAKANTFLDILVSKGPNAYEHLVYSLKKDKTQMFIVEKLNKEFESRKCLYMGGSKSQRVDLPVDVKRLPKPPKPHQNQACKDQGDSLCSTNKNHPIMDKNEKSRCNAQDVLCERNGQREITPKESDGEQNGNSTIQSLQKAELEKYNSTVKSLQIDSFKNINLEELMRKPDETNA